MPKPAIIAKVRELGALANGTNQPVQRLAIDRALTLLEDDIVASAGERGTAFARNQLAAYIERLAALYADLEAQEDANAKAIAK